jgi:hypothetical protein
VCLFSISCAKSCPKFPNFLKAPLENSKGDKMDIEPMLLRHTIRSESAKHARSKVQFGKALTNQGYEQVRDSTGRYWQGLSISIVG